MTNRHHSNNNASLLNTSSRRRKSSLSNNNRYQYHNKSDSKSDTRHHGRKIPIIRETRSSRMRKSALVVDVMRKERAKIHQKTSKLVNNSGVRPTAANSPKNNNFNGKQRSSNKRTLGLTSSSNHKGSAYNNNRILEISHNLSNLHDQSFELVNSGAGSPRVNVHPDEFITGHSFKRYQRHRSPEKSLDDKAWRTLLTR